MKKFALLFICLAFAGVLSASVPSSEGSLLSASVNEVLDRVSLEHLKVVQFNVREYQKRAALARFVVFKKVKTEDDKKLLLLVLNHTKQSLQNLIPFDVLGAQGFFLKRLSLIEENVKKENWDEVKTAVMPVVTVINRIEI